MTFSEYQKYAYQTALPTAKNLTYMILGLSSEVGEVAGKLKKEIRDNINSKEAITAEIGDVLWYLAGITTVLNLDLEEIAKSNLLKLQDRQQRNTISGNGDYR